MADKYIYLFYYSLKMSLFLSKIFGNMGKNKISTQLFGAYHQNNFSKLSEMLKIMGEGEVETFINCKVNGLTLIHQAVKDQNEEVIEILSQDLPYFRKIVDDDSNEHGITPLNLAV